jgi:hypothetical protein
MNKIMFYTILFISLSFGSSCNNSSNKLSSSRIQDSLKFSDSAAYNDTASLPNRSINAELIGGDSTVNLALAKTFSQSELLNIYKQKAGTLTVFCTFDKFGKVTNAYIDYCKCSNLIKRKFELLINNVEKYVRFRVGQYYIKRIEKLESFYTSFLIVNLKLFSVDEIAKLDTDMNFKFQSFIDTTRNCK